MAISCKGQPLPHIPHLGLYTMLLLPILYVEWQNRGRGETTYCAILIAKYNSAIKQVLKAKNGID